MRQRLTALVLVLTILIASATELPVSRSGTSRPDPTTVSSCSEWKHYEAHWMKLTRCHSGESNTACCELYDFMAKSIRIFNDKLGCRFPDLDEYSTKFTVHCSSAGRIPGSSNDDAKGVLTPPGPSGGGSTHSHGSGPVQVLEDGNPKTTTGHTTTGTGGCLNCGSGTSGCSGGYCGHGCQGGNCNRPCQGGDCNRPCQGGDCNRPCQGGDCNRPCQGRDCNRPCQGVSCGVGCSGPHCGRPQTGCSGGYCGGCSGSHCGSGCSGSGCNRPPVGACIGYNCGCAKCCVSGNCGGSQQGSQSGSQSGQPNQGINPIVLPDDGNDVCFHGDGVVKLGNGGVKLMRELRVGDVVHVGGGKFSTVFMFTHQDADKRSSYVNMTVGSGEWVMVTPTHYMYSDKGLQLAGELKEGDIVEMDDGRMEEIVIRTVVRDKGLYNPQTFHGDVAVSGFRASTYTRTIQYETAHSLLAPLRAMYRICGAHISAAF